MYFIASKAVFFDKNKNDKYRCKQFSKINELAV
jgi:hypothetical protein